jgi:hypothetical protein
MIPVFIFVSIIVSIVFIVNNKFQNKTNSIHLSQMQNLKNAIELEEKKTQFFFNQDTYDKQWISIKNKFSIIAAQIEILIMIENKN